MAVKGSGYALNAGQPKMWLTQLLGDISLHGIGLIEFSFCFGGILNVLYVEAKIDGSEKSGPIFLKGVFLLACCTMRMQ